MAVHEGPWPEGTPAWVDLMVPDRRVADAFYGPIFGWEFDDGEPETGYYTSATRGGRRAAGIGQDMPGTQPPPRAWTTYLAVDDADAAAARAVEAGAQLLVEPMDVRDLGRMAMLADPTGAVVGLWQSGTHTGAGVVAEPGSLGWNEVMTHGFGAARRFYRDVFGYTFGEMSTDDFSYATLDLAGTPVGGIGELGADAPDDARPSWVPYFLVSDTDAAVALALELGGAVVTSAMDTEFGRVAVLRGPFGEQFALMSTTAPSSEPLP